MLLLSLYFVQNEIIVIELGLGTIGRLLRPFKQLISLINVLKKQYKLCQIGSFLIVTITMTRWYLLKLASLEALYSYEDLFALTTLYNNILNMIYTDRNECM